MSDRFKAHLKSFFGKLCSMPHHGPLSSSEMTFYAFDAKKERKGVDRLVAAYVSSERSASARWSALAADANLPAEDIVLFGFTGVPADETGEHDQGLEAALDTTPQVDGILYYDRKSGCAYLYPRQPICGPMVVRGGLLRKTRQKTVDELKIQIAKKKRAEPLAKNSDAPKVRADGNYALSIGAVVRDKKKPPSVNRFGGSSGVSPSRWPKRDGKPLAFLFQLATGELLTSHAGVAVFVAVEPAADGREDGGTVALLLDEKELVAKPRTRTGPYKEQQFKVIARKEKCTKDDSTIGGKPTAVPRGFRFLAQFNFMRDGMHLAIDDGDLFPSGLLQLFVNEDESVVRVVWREGRRVVSSEDFASA